MKTVVGSVTGVDHPVAPTRQPGADPSHAPGRRAHASGCHSGAGRPNGPGHDADGAQGAPRPSSWPAAALIMVFRLYQMARVGRVSPCRFTPTCSQYAIEAVARHGAWRGVRLALRRLGRCRPGGPSGYDPIPERD